MTAMLTEQVRKEFADQGIVPGVNITEADGNDGKTYIVPPYDKWDYYCTPSHSFMPGGNRYSGFYFPFDTGTYHGNKMVYLNKYHNGIFKGYAQAVEKK